MDKSGRQDSGQTGARQKCQHRDRTEPDKGYFPGAKKCTWTDENKSAAPGDRKDESTINQYGAPLDECLNGQPGIPSSDTLLLDLTSRQINAVGAKVVPNVGNLVKAIFLSPAKFRRVQTNLARIGSL